MGQYHLIVNLDKREFLHPHKLGSGLKAWEIMANHPGPMEGLVPLLMCSNGRGGGDLDSDWNYHGPERGPEHNMGLELDGDYQQTAAQVIGRWKGDRIAIIGDYTEDGDIPGVPTEVLYLLCVTKYDTQSEIDWKKERREVIKQLNKEHPQPPPTKWKASDLFTDISDLVSKVIAHELQMELSGTGWKSWRSIDPNDSVVRMAWVKRMLVKHPAAIAQLEAALSLE